MVTRYDSLRWREYLSYGYRSFDEELFTPGIGLIVSPDGRKIIVIGDEELPAPELDEESRILYISVRNGGIGARFTCPGCEQYYIIALEEHDQPRSEIKYITNNPFQECACGVEFAINDKYEFMSVSFLIDELAPLYLIGMSRVADLLLRYKMPDDATLVEELGTVSRMPNDPSLTIALRRCAYWTSLLGAPETANRDGQTIYIPKINVFDAAALTALMNRIARRERVTYAI